MKNAFPRATWIPLFLAIVCFTIALPLIFGSAREKARQVTTLTSLKVIGREILLYAESHDGKLPPLQNIDALIAALPRISRSQAESAGWNLPFATSAYWQNVRLQDVPKPSEKVFVYEDRALWAGGTYRGVLFADGHAKMVSESQWATIKENSSIMTLNEPSVARWWELKKSGPREPAPEGTLGWILAGNALFWLAVAAGLRARLSPKPSAEFVVALLTYVTLALVLGSVAVSFIPRIA